MARFGQLPGCCPSGSWHNYSNPFSGTACPNPDAYIFGVGRILDGNRGRDACLRGKEASCAVDVICGEIAGCPGATSKARILQLTIV